MKFSEWLISVLSETVALPNLQRTPVPLCTGWDSLWFERQSSHYWVGFQWPGFCRPWQPLRGRRRSGWTMKRRCKYRVSVESLSCELLPPCLLILLLFSFFLICSLQETLHLDPRRLESEPLCVLIMFLLHPYGLGVQLTARPRADRRDYPRTFSRGFWSYM